MTDLQIEDGSTVSPPIVSYNLLLKSGTFTFRIGEDEDQFVVHKKVIEDNSPVLSNLMNNGALEESITGIAHLKDTDPETFTLFSEYIYTGMYRVEQPPQNEQARDFRISCSACLFYRPISCRLSILPKTCPQCWSTAVVLEDTTTQRIVWQSTLKLPSDPKRQRKYDVSSNPDSVRVAARAAILSFQNLTYPALGRSHETMRQYLEVIQPPDSTSKNVLAHAKLYVFAEKYMIDSLKALCLHKLHRDLCDFNIDRSNVGEIKDLVAYTYANTCAGDSDSNSQNSSSSAATASSAQNRDLRTLVLLYTLANAKTLMTDRSFEEVIQAGGEFVIDFMKGIARRLV